MDFDMFGTPVLTTKRLVLNKLSEKDASDIYRKIMCDGEVGRYMLEYTAPDLDKVREYVDSIIDLSVDVAYNYWAVRQGGRFIGTISLFAQFEHRRGSIAYQLVRDEWGKGYTTEALNEVVRFAFLRLGLHRLEAECFAENKASERVLEKCGFRHEATARDKVFKDNEYHDIVTYARFSTDRDN